MKHTKSMDRSHVTQERDRLRESLKKTSTVLIKIAAQSKATPDLQLEMASAIKEANELLREGGEHR